MKFFKILALLFCLNWSLNAQTKVERPKLVVGIVVDQMRWDYLYRFQERYTEDGFKRLMRDGFNCENTQINYLPTFTAPGHASIYTGSVPAFHGIVANNWWDTRNGDKWYCTEDKTVKSIGGGKAGLMSPRPLLANTVTDELRLATQFASRTFGISIKDRGSILPAGHTANAAFWYDEETGNFITSSYYMQELPSWLKSFNLRNVGDSLMLQDWKTLFPINTYIQSTADDNEYEGAVKGETKPVFPHLTSAALKRKDKGAIRTTPWGNELTAMAAKACIEYEGLGQRAATDFLAISFSSTDYIGHQYGPNSIEVEDTYLRLDRILADFLNFLDEKIGEGQYTLFLTADHGGAHNPKFLNDHGMPGKSISIKEVNKNLNDHLKTAFGKDSLVNSLYNYQVFLNEAMISNQKLDREKIRTAIKNWLKIQDGVNAVIDMENPERMVPAILTERSANGYMPNRCGSIQIVLNAAWYSGYAATGSTHGSWNPYDSQIPLLWFGYGIQKGSSFKTTYITDIAPTLAAILKIQKPNACIGEVIEDVMIKK